MKIFLDAADIADIHWALGTGLIDGITTTPAFRTRETDSTSSGSLAELCRLVPGPVCVDVAAVDAAGMYREGRELAKVADNVVVMVPMIEEGLVAVRRLAGEGVRVNTTLIFNAAQAMFAAKAGASYVSPFLGPLDDVGVEGIAVIRDIREVFDRHEMECLIMAAAVRSPLHVISAARIGADAAAVPASILRALMVHPLTDRGLDQFLDEWSKRITRARRGS